MRVGAIVEGDGNFLVRAADAVDVIGKRDGVVGFIGEEIAGWVVLKGAFAVLRRIRKVPDVAVAFED